MTKSTAEAQAEVEATRRALQQDIGALKEKAAPDQMMREAKAQLAERGRRTADRAAAYAKANPFPLVAAGAGVAAAWLLLHRRRSPRAEASSGIGRPRLSRRRRRMAS